MALTYEWQQFYKAAISEADPRKMREDITKAGTRNSTAPGRLSATNHGRS
jgi:hypothetical protein